MFKLSYYSLRGDCMSDKTDLRQLLKKGDDRLYTRLEPIREKMEATLSYTQGKFLNYTPHDLSHGLSVETTLNRLIPDHVKAKMNPFEIFFLLIAAWSHDWGMVGKAEEDSEKIRKTHHLRTEQNFAEMYKELGLSKHEGRIVGRICRGHRKVDLRHKDFDTWSFKHMWIRRRFLAALLRIADECDITHMRTPEVLYHTLQPTGKDKEEFQKHLQISGIVPQNNNIYISAVAQDPLELEILQKLEKKIQDELDAVKGILAEEGVILERVIVEVEPEGFIKQLIRFSVNDSKLLELLIGDRLYSRKDVVIRELVQNAIDACILRQKLEPDVQPHIILRKTSNYLEVEDNGFGMDLSIAKHFLSTVGMSYYTSEGIKKLINDQIFDPIAQFGIGILSCFRIADEVIIETKRTGHKPWKFIIKSVAQPWRPEKGSLKTPGTKVILQLNEEGKHLDLLKTLEHYCIAPEISIYYQTDDKEPKKLQDGWSLDQIRERLPKSSLLLTSEESTEPKELLRFETDSYNVLFGIAHPLHHELILCNHGIFVGRFPIRARNIVCVDIKKNLIDLQLSRETVIPDSKWDDFLYNVFSELFTALHNQYPPDNFQTYFHMISSVIDFETPYLGSFKKDLQEDPFIRSFLECVLFPVISQNGLELQNLDYLLNHDEINFYRIESYAPPREIQMLSEVFSRERVTLFDPYKTPITLIKSFLESQGVTVYEIDLQQVLVEGSTPLEHEFGNLIPPNVKLARFPPNLRPLVVFYKNPTARSESPGLSETQFLTIGWLFGEQKVSEIMKDAPWGNAFEDIKLLSEPQVYVDAEDEFIQKMFSSIRKNNVDNQLSQTVSEYFKCLMFFPLAFGGPESFFLIFKRLNSLEEEIANVLNFECPPPFQRVGPIKWIYFDFLLEQAEAKMVDWVTMTGQ